MEFEKTSLTKEFFSKEKFFLQNRNFKILLWKFSRTFNEEFEKNEFVEELVERSSKQKAIHSKTGAHVKILIVTCLH